MLVSAQNARKWISRAIRRIVGSSTRPYRPEFSGEELLRALAGAGDHSEVPSSARDADGLECREHEATRLARQRFGPRFFVHPDDVPSLWQQLTRSFPEWHRRQVEAVHADVHEGLPMYAVRGPALAAEFPWAGLPDGPGGDGMYAKRPHRFAFAPRHALACHHDAAATSRLQAVLKGWIHCAEQGASPYCYDSNLGVIQRLLALSWCWAFVTGRSHEPDREQAELEWTILRVIQADIRFLEPRLGHSAPNNHLLADRFAAWYLSTVFPEFLASPVNGNEEAAWRDELLRQTYPDGGGFEHSTHYHEFACEMGVAYILLCRRQRRAPDPRIEERVAALLRFQCALSGPECVPLPIGNAVEDALFPLDPDEGWCSGSLRELRRALFEPAIAPAPVESAGWIRAFWLLGGALASAPAEASPAPALEAFPDTGVHVFTDAARGARLVFRTAPRPGVQVAPGHMHADLLSVCLNVEGRPLLVDPGTYTYRSPAKRWDPGTPAWRTYFAGPTAHNGPVIADEDPLGQPAGDFRQTGDEARSEDVVRTSDHLALVHAGLSGAGVYEGAGRTCIGVAGEYWLIIDRPPCSDGADSRCHYGFQLVPGAAIECHERWASLRTGPNQPVTNLAYGGDVDRPECLKGSLDPLDGWVSPAYGRLERAPRLRFPVAEAASRTAFLLRPRTGDDSECVIAAVETIGSGTAIQIVCEDFEDLVLCRDCRDNSEQWIEYPGIRFQGLVCWLRSIDGRPHALRWLDGRCFAWPEHGIRIARDELCATSLEADSDPLTG